MGDDKKLDRDIERFMERAKDEGVTVTVRFEPGDIERDGELFTTTRPTVILEPGTGDLATDFPFMAEFLMQGVWDLCKEMYGDKMGTTQRAMRLGEVVARIAAQEDRQNTLAEVGIDEETPFGEALGKLKAELKKRKAQIEDHREGEAAETEAAKFKGEPAADGTPAGWEDVNPTELADGALDRIRDQSQEYKDLLAAFPPFALVRAKDRTLRMPAPGRVAMVLVHGKFDESKKGMILVTDRVQGGRIAECEPGWLEVVRCHPGLDGGMVRLLLEEARGEA